MTPVPLGSARCGMSSGADQCVQHGSADRNHYLLRVSS